MQKPDLEMDIEELLRRKRPAVLDRWIGMIAETYPAETARFLREREDRFANPVGYTIVRTVEVLYDALVQRENVDAVSEHLQPLLRIRAVQDFSPAQAVGFVFGLKEAIRQELKNEAQADEIAGQLLLIESRIDDLALLAFDLYMDCRERIYKIRHDEVRRQTLTLLKRANRHL